VLIWRRIAIWQVLLFSTITFCISLVPESAPPPLPFAPVVAVYTAALYRRTALSAAASGVVIVAVLASLASRPEEFNDDLALAYVTSLVGAWLLGYGAHLNRARAALLHAEMTRAEAARTRKAIEAEQARIARELHDIVAHNVSVIVAQAGAARLVFDAEPEQARESLAGIEASGREALTEMRLLLGVLHDGDERPERFPQPGLGQLPGLVTQVRRAGLPVTVAVEGEARPLPAGVELSAYRIVQESLTNALKHAGSTSALVTLTYSPEQLIVDVADSGKGTAGEPGVGHGLIGMRERASLLGGELVAGPRREGGFRVTAKLPVSLSAIPILSAESP
jgi:signal transduction histidine kinase